MVPGPGQYVTADNKIGRQHSPNWSMGTSKRETANKLLNVPGPGAYEPAKKVFREFV